MTMSRISYDACQRYWRFETSVIVCDVFSAFVLTAPVCSARMCVYLETRQGKMVCTVYKVSLFCSVLFHFGQICLFSTILMKIKAISVIGPRPLTKLRIHWQWLITFPDWLIMPSKCLSAKVTLIKPIDLHLYLISDWNSIIKITFFIKQQYSRLQNSTKVHVSAMWLRCVCLAYIPMTKGHEAHLLIRHADSHICS